MATPLHCSQNHSPLGAVESLTHWKWNHSMGQSLCSQAIMSPHSAPPQIHHNSELSRGALPDFLNDFPFLFAVAFWAPAWRCFTWFRLNINCIGWWSESKICVDQTTLTFFAPSAIFGSSKWKTGTQFLSCRGPTWGRNPKSKSVKWTTLRGQFVVQKWFNAPIIPYPSPGPKGWGFQLTGA